MTQENLPYGGHAPSEDVPTSQEAARSIEPRLQPLQKCVLSLFGQFPNRGLTDDELERLTGLKHQTVSARRRELFLMRKLAYKLDAEGNKVRRKTRSGRSAYVFVVAP